MLPARRIIKGRWAVTRRHDRNIAGKVTPTGRAPIRTFPMKGKPWLVPDVGLFLSREFELLEKYVGDPEFIRDVIGTAVKLETFRPRLRPEDQFTRVPSVPQSLRGEIVDMGTYFSSKFYATVMRVAAPHHVFQFKTKFPALAKKLDEWLFSGGRTHGDESMEMAHRQMGIFADKMLRHAWEFALNDDDYEQEYMTSMGNVPVKVNIAGEVRTIWKISEFQAREMHLISYQRDKEGNPVAIPVRGTKIGQAYVAWNTDGDFWEKQTEIKLKGSTWSSTTGFASTLGPIPLTPNGFPDFRGIPVMIFYPENNKEINRRKVK